MQPGGLSLTHINALSGSHAQFTQVDVWRGGQRVATDIEFDDGSISATLTTGITRECDLVVPLSLYPVDADDLLNPYTDYLKIFGGVVLGDGMRLSWPLFRGRIQTIDKNGQGRVDLHASDRCAEIDENKFLKPESSVVGANVLTETQRVIRDGVNDANFGDCDSYTEVMPQLTWEHERGEALDEIAVAVGSFWYCLADGDFVLRRVPWVVDTTPIGVYAEAPVLAAGELLADEISRNRRRDTVFNSVTATGERADGSAPVYATVEDNNPASATYVDGPMGRRNKLLQLRTPQTVQTCTDAARSYMRRSTGRFETISSLQARNCALELGDCFTLRDQLGELVQVVAGYDLPLRSDQQMSVQWRSLVVGLVEV
jgi:hypothetical protein